MPDTFALTSCSADPLMDGCSHATLPVSYAVVSPYSTLHEVVAWFSGLTWASRVAANGVRPEKLSLTTTGLAASVSKVRGRPGASSVTPASVCVATTQNVYGVRASRPVSGVETFIFVPVASAPCVVVVPAVHSPLVLYVNS